MRAWVTMLALAVLFHGAPAAAQQACEASTSKKAAAWVSLDFGLGLAATIPTDGKMKLMPAAFLYHGGLTLNLPKRTLLSLLVAHKEYEGKSYSTHHYAKHTDLLLVGRYRAVAKRFFEWQVGLALGVSVIRLEFEEQALVANPDGKGEPVPVTDPTTGLPKYILKREQILTLDAGAGTRFLVFPLEPLAIFLDLSMHYAWWEALTPDEGPLQLHLSMGLEGHF